MRMAFCLKRPKGLSMRTTVLVPYYVYVVGYSYLLIVDSIAGLHFSIIFELFYM